MMRTAISAASSSALPVSALGTNSRVGSWPISGRIRCGATRPMKPMAPDTATEPPTPSATPVITMSRSRSTSTPRLSAVPSPRRRNQADEADGAGHGDRTTDAERDACYHHEPQPVDIDAKALRRLFAEAERAEGVAPAHQNDRARHD